MPQLSGYKRCIVNNALCIILGAYYFATTLFKTFLSLFVFLDWIESRLMFYYIYSPGLSGASINMVCIFCPTILTLIEDTPEKRGGKIEGIIFNSYCQNFGQVVMVCLTSCLQNLSLYSYPTRFEHVDDLSSLCSLFPFITSRK